MKELLSQFLTFLWEEKIWWMTPLVLLVLGLIAFILLTEKESVMPLVYDLF